MKNKKNTAEEIEIKPSKTCDMCDWKTNYTVVIVREYKAEADYIIMIMIIL